MIGGNGERIIGHCGFDHMIGLQRDWREEVHLVPERSSMEIVNNLGRPLTPQEIAFLEKRELHGRGYSNFDVGRMSKEEKGRVLAGVTITVTKDTLLKESSPGFFR